MKPTPVPLPRPKDTNLERPSPEEVRTLMAGFVGALAPDGISEYRREAGHRLVESSR